MSESYDLDDPLHIYLMAAGGVPLLDPADENALISKLLSRDPASESVCQRLLEANLFLVVPIAERHADSQVQILDLIQAGNDGLMAAILSLNDDYSPPFSAYAVPFIEHAVTLRIAACSLLT